MKLTYDGFTMEGTPEEIKEMMTAMGAEFPEKGTPNEATPSLKKGDRAKLLSERGALSGFTAGEEVTVRNPNSTGKHGVAIEGVSHGIIGFTDADNLEKIVEDDTPTFKGGDRVKTLADGEDGDIKAGEVGIVDAVLEDSREEGDPYYIEVKTEDDYDYFRPQDLELVAEESEEKPHTVKRKARVGERILITDASLSFGYYKNGDILTVDSLYGGNGVNIKENPSAAYIGHDEYEVVIEDTYRPSEGDIVVITGESHFESRGSSNEVGDIGKVVGRGNTYETSVKVSVPGRIQSKNYTHESELRPATDEEKAQYELALKWAKIGRKPGEFKKGDIVRVKWSRGNKSDEIAEVHRGSIGPFGGGNYYLDDGGDETLGRLLELIAPVEARVDL